MRLGFGGITGKPKKKNRKIVGRNEADLIYDMFNACMKWAVVWGFVLIIFEIIDRVLG